MALPPLATPATLLEQVLRQFADDALVYTRPDRFLILTNASGTEQLWLTARICNMINDATEQRGLWSSDGRYLAIICTPNPDSESILTSLLDAQTGQVQLVSFRTGDATAESWSPSAPQVLVRSIYDEATWFVVDAPTGQRTQLIALSDTNTSAAWSPDGTRVAVTGKVAEQQDAVYLINADGGDLRQLRVDNILDFYALNGPVSWSLDGRFLLLNRELNPATDTYTYQAIRLDIDTGAVEVLADNLDHFLEFHWSPDGAWFLMGQPGRPGAYLGRWSLHQADGTLARSISIDPDRDDIAFGWLPDSQRFVSIAVRLSVSVEIILSDLKGHDQVIARYPNTRPSFPALAIAPNGTLMAISLSNQAIVVVDIHGKEQAMFQGRLNEWRPHQSGLP